jgi:hypothetical protein
MNHLLAVENWNKRFMPGLPVVIERHVKFTGKTITPAQLKDGKAVIYADSMAGPIPLEWVRPEKDLWKFLQLELAERGFKPGASDEIDAESIAGSTCETCHAAREYHAYRRPGADGEYRAFAVCMGCGDVEEF